MRQEVWTTVVAFVLVMGMYTVALASTGTAMDASSTNYEGLIDWAAWIVASGAFIFILLSYAQHNAHGTVFATAVVLLVCGGLVGTRNEWKGFVGMVEGATLLPALLPLPY